MKRLIIGTVVACLLGTAVPSNAAVVKVNGACKSLGAVVKQRGVLLKCTRTNGKLVWRTVRAATTTNPAPATSPTPTPTTETPAASKPTFLQSAEPLDTCRIKDGRTSKTRVPESIAYPVGSGMQAPGLPATGTVKVAVIPVDFSDAVGTEEPRILIDPLVKNSDAWLSHFANGKLRYEWQTSSTWIRAPKPSSEYVWVHPGPVAKNPIPGATSAGPKEAVWIANDLITAADKAYDFSGVGILMFVYPTNTKNIWDAVTTFGTVRTDEGVRSVQINAAGAWLYYNKMPVWPWFIHENLHPHGLAGHGSDGAPLDIMTNQAGMSFALSSWDALILDWQRDDQFYCVNAATLRPTAVPLSPLDSSETGTKAVIIRLSDHEALVVESRRRSTWSSGFDGWGGLPDSFAGVTVTRIDTTIDVNRTQDASYARYLPKVQAATELVSGGYGSFNTKFLARAGESVEYNGIRLSISQISGYDMVRVERI